MTLTFWGKTFSRPNAEQNKQGKLCQVKKSGLATVLWIECEGRRCEIRLTTTEVEQIKNAGKGHNDE